MNFTQLNRTVPLPFISLSTRNSFINRYIVSRVAQFLKLPVEPTPSFRVLIGNGQYMETKGLIPELCVQVQGQELQLPVYLLPIVGADLILGSTWLATLGPHVADYASSSIKFVQQGTFITLQGDKALSPTQAQFHQLKRMYTTDAIAEAFSIQQISHVTPDDELIELPTDIEPELATLLHTYMIVQNYLLVEKRITLWCYWQMQNL